jgi:hypothetical protein
MSRYLRDVRLVGRNCLIAVIAYRLIALRAHNEPQGQCVPLRCVKYCTRKRKSKDRKENEVYWLVVGLESGRSDVDLEAWSGDSLRSPLGLGCLRARSC